MADDLRALMDYRIPILLALCFGLAAAAATGQAAAQAAAQSGSQAATPPGTRPAEPLGRMFFTPAQRASLDIARTQRARTTVATEQTEQQVATAAPVPQTITFDGTVRRSDGKTTFWINNRAVNESEQPGGGVVVGRVRPDGGISLQLPQSGRGVELKVGQSIELLSGTIEEPYSRKPAVAAPEPKPAAKPAVEAKGAKPPSPEAARAEREREERQREVAEEAVSRVLQERAGAKPGVTPLPPQAPPR